MEIAAANRRMKKDLDAAARIQRSLLPATLPDRSGLRFAWAYNPCDELAGDILNVFELDENTIALYLLDVSGHGVPAALLSVALSQMLSPSRGASSFVRVVGPDGVSQPAAPAAVASRLNERFQMNDTNEQYFTLLYGLLNPASRELCYVCAGHPSPVHVPCGRPPDLLTISSDAVGWLEDAQYEEVRVTLRPGDRLYWFSDGVLEAVNTAQDAYGRDRLLAFLEQNRAVPLEESVERLRQTIVEWSDGHPADDVSILAVESVASGT